MPGPAVPVSVRAVEREEARHTDRLSEGSRRAQTPEGLASVKGIGTVGHHDTPPHHMAEIRLGAEARNAYRLDRWSRSPVF